MPDLLVYAWLLFAALVAANRRLRGNSILTRAPGAWLGIVVQALGFSVTYIYYVRPLLSLELPPIPNSVPLAQIQSALGFSSVCLALWANWSLGRQWSVAAEVIKHHALITSGPYRVVRHPIYAGMCGMLVASGLAVPNPLALVFGSAIFLVGTSIRVHFEERLLRERFGEQFTRYAERVPAFIPVRLPRSSPN